MNELAVFGASGQTGGLIVELALARGQAARVLVRPSAAFDARPGVTVLRGSLEEAKDVLETLSGTDAVCCVFGPTSDDRDAILRPRDRPGDLRHEVRWHPAPRLPDGRDGR